MLAVILAGGKGIRMMPLTKDKPKAMIAFKGKPILEHLLDALVFAGINSFVIVVGYKKEKIIGYFGNKYKGIPIRYVAQKKPLGTAHALLQAKKLAEDKENFIVCNADVIPSVNDIKRMLIAKSKNILAIRQEDHPENFGVVSFNGNKVVSIAEKPKEAKSPSYVNVGLYKFSPEIFEIIPKLKKSRRNEYELTDALKELIARKKLKCLKMKNRVIDISKIEDLNKWGV
ncbi:MAG: nucleotidyltransferase family protein [Candidatus Diapherotrites archaeon]|nr:nucleotidyltransferase family protein [Candidatus Diapherotrites archaeon]